jgi:parallel beta-helix repeat protein
VINDNSVLTDSTNTAAAITCLTAGAGTDGKNGVISGNYIESGSTGIVIQLTAGGNRPSKVSVTGNTVKILAAGASASFISIAGADNITVAGNLLDANGFSRGQGIEVVNSNHCTVTGNTCLCTGTFPYGIFLNQASYCTVTGNNIRDIRDVVNANGIRLFSNSATVCTDNTISANVILMTAGGTVAKSGISLETNNASAHVDRNVIVGNVVYGGNVASTPVLKFGP